MFCSVSQLQNKTELLPFLFVLAVQHFENIALPNDYMNNDKTKALFTKSSGRKNYHSLQKSHIMSFKNILFPTDFSGASINAFNYAVKLAEQLDAKIELVNVYRIPMAAVPDLPPANLLQDSNRQYRQESKKKMSEMMIAYAGEVEIKQTPIYGIFVADEIADYAKDHNIDLIIMGTKGEHGALDRFVGTTTTDVTLKAPCAVLAVPEGSKYEPLKSLAFATDYLRDREAILSLHNFAEKLGAEIHVVHAEKNEEQIEQNAEIDVYETRRFTDFTVIHDRSIEEGIDAFIAEKNVNLLAMYLPHRKLWERLFHTSFTKEMVFHTDIPLLIFREEAS
jgi:nucleotide-binding universal stress UspA family protein